MKYERCKTCGKYGFSDTHRCPPVWEVRINDGDWFEVYAIDAQGAASDGAESYDEDGEYSIVRRGSAKAWVRKLGDEEEKAFDIEAESRPHYSAWEAR